MISKWGLVHVIVCLFANLVTTSGCYFNYLFNFIPIDLKVNSFLPADFLTKHWNEPCYSVFMFLDMFVPVSSFFYAYSLPCLLPLFGLVRSLTRPNLKSDMLESGTHTVSLQIYSAFNLIGSPQCQSQWYLHPSETFCGKRCSLYQVCERTNIYKTRAATTTKVVSSSQLLGLRNFTSTASHLCWAARHNNCRSVCWVCQSNSQLHSLYSSFTWVLCCVLLLHQSVLI